MVLGGASGADEVARRFAVSEKVSHLVLYPDWSKYGKAAGMIRNKEMVHASLSMSHDGAVTLAAFPGGRGTANMVSMCKDRGIPVVYYTEWKNAGNGNHW